MRREDFGAAPEQELSFNAADIEKREISRQKWTEYRCATGRYAISGDETWKAITDEKAGKPRHAQVESPQVAVGKELACKRVKDQSTLKFRGRRPTLKGKFAGYLGRRVARKETRRGARGTALQVRRGS